MKQEVMKLKKAIKKNYVSVGTESIRYVPDYNEVVAIGKRTGSRGIQKFKTENFSWRLIELENKKLALIPMDSTNQFLILQGKAGSEKSKKTLNNICSKLWSSKSLGLEAKSIEIAEYEQMPIEVKKTIKNAWLGNHQPVDVEGDFIEVVYYVDEYSAIKNYPLYSKKHGEQSLYKEIVPIVYLSSEMLIDTTSKILFRDSKQIAKYKLSKLIEEATISEEILSELNEILKLL